MFPFSLLNGRSYQVDVLIFRDSSPGICVLVLLNQFLEDPDGCRGNQFVVYCLSV